MYTIDGQVKQRVEPRIRARYTDIMLIDKLAGFNRLTKAGMPAAQADAVVQTVDGAGVRVVTKPDLRKMELKLINKIQATAGWSAGIIIGALTVAVAVIKWL